MRILILVQPMLMVVNGIACRFDLARTTDDRGRTLEEHRHSQQWVWGDYAGPIAAALASVPIGVASALVVTDPVHSYWAWWLTGGVLLLAALLASARRRVARAQRDPDTAAMRNHLSQIVRRRTGEPSRDEMSRIRAAISAQIHENRRGVNSRIVTELERLAFDHERKPNLRLLLANNFRTLAKFPRPFWQHWLLLACHLVLFAASLALIVRASLSATVEVDVGASVGFVGGLIALAAIGWASSTYHLRYWLQLARARFTLKSGQLDECEALVRRLGARDVSRRRLLRTR